MQRDRRSVGDRKPCEIGRLECKAAAVPCTRLQERPAGEVRAQCESVSKVLIVEVGLGEPIAIVDPDVVAVDKVGIVRLNSLLHSSDESGFRTQNLR